MSPVFQHFWPCLSAWSLTVMRPNHWSNPYSQLLLHPQQNPLPATFRGTGDSAPGKHQACQDPFLHIFSRKLQFLASNGDLFGAYPLVFFKLMPSFQRLPPSLLPCPMLSPKNCSKFRGFLFNLSMKYKPLCEILVGKIPASLLFSPLLFPC